MVSSSSSGPGGSPGPSLRMWTCLEVGFSCGFWSCFQIQRQRLKPKRDACMFSRLVGSNSLQAHGLQPARPSVHGILQARILEQVAFPSPEDLPDPEIKSMSPELQADTLPSEPQGIFNIFRWICLKIQFCWALLLGTPEIIFHSIYEKIKIRVLQQ